MPVILWTIIRWIRYALGAATLVTGTIELPKFIYEYAPTLYGYLGEIFVSVLAVVCSFLLALVIVGPKRALALRQLLPRRVNREEQRAQDAALDAYLNQMEQWLHDQNRPLRRATRDDEVRASAQERTLTVLERLGPDGKRNVLRFVHRHRLIEHDETIISLYGADLSGANLSGISLTDANLDGAILSDADLSHAKLCGAFRGGSAELARAAQRGGDWFDLARPMRTSSFFNAKLNGAVLERAALVCCHMIGADFAGANLDRADLRGADLRLTRNLTQEQIERAYGSSGQQEHMPDTQLPDGLHAPEAWRRLLSQQRQRES